MTTFYSDYEGDRAVYSTARTKEKALKDMQEELLAEHIDHKIDPNQIEKDRMYYCRDCEFYSYGENICCECGEVIENRTGRQTFAYHLLSA